MKPNPDIKAIITLYGPANIGKTATLRYLFFLLIQQDYSLFQNLVGKKKDFRAILDYNGKTIRFSTVGDTKEQVDLNWKLFSDWQSFPSRQKRNFIRFSQNCGSDIVISPTHLKDATSKLQDQRIAEQKSYASYIQYYQKRRAHLRICASIPKSTWTVLTGSENPGDKWNDSMAKCAIHAAVEIKEQLDNIIKHL